MKKRVLFLCIGNICRSPMAEALARKYGSDVLVAESAGLSPAPDAFSWSRKVLSEINVDLGDHVPRRLLDLSLNKYDIIVNMSGQPLPFDPGGVRVETWNVPDPFGGTEEDFRRTREQLEMLVMNLILKIRTGKI